MSNLLCLPPGGSLVSEQGGSLYAAQEGGQDIRG
jgi:hypothetical protein